MRDLKFLAGLGTVFIFIGIFCFKAALQKETISSHAVPRKPRKGLLIFSGIISSAIGIVFLLLAIRKIK